MIDLRILRDNPEHVVRLLGTRNVPADEVAELLRLDTELRQALADRDQVRASVNQLSRSVGELRRTGQIEEANRAQLESRSLGERAKELEARAQLLTEARDAIWLVTPNLPSKEAPIGEDERDNRIVRYWSPSDGHRDADAFELPAFEEYQRVPHWETGADLGILDFERARKISGSMFSLFRGPGARLLRSLTSLALDMHTESFEEIRPPTLVKRETMQATGHLPKFVDEAYAIERDDLYLIPTAEVPLTSLGRNEILDEAELPLRFAAYTPCFRREAGAAGRDTRGLLRLHEFDKVELLAYCMPSQGYDLLFEVLRRAELLLQGLGLTYRVLDLCTGDLGQSSARTFDLEVYSPGTDKWLEVSSVSLFTDYQARRANIRYRASTGDVNYVYTVNGSALAWGRVVAAMLEVGRQPDGSVVLAEVLAPYFGRPTITKSVKSSAPISEEA
ncbi:MULTISPECIES: serine--tRNA ligase [Ferrimicrobium]|jgi:seryl-tRNA synthetase|uniref:Serine--tRNA ligase n=1 Tax=Ferrimicrobium acidiphilum TaxID=121039 RepID=A0ABV3Y4I1_9ACTN|nr:serine--tRNA ligase [Ferrimicrobium sp.]MCL5973283.1 serine--tRNA ligase [Actinomycetota bacterium]